MALSSGSVTLSVAVFLASEEKGGGSLTSGILLTCESLESLETAPVHCQFLCGVYQGLDEYAIRIHSLRCSRGGLCFFLGRPRPNRGKKNVCQKGESPELISKLYF